MIASSRDDSDRYPFVVRVKNVSGKERTVAFGAEDGHVICQGPTWWQGDGDELQEEAIGSAYAQAVRLARLQRAAKAKRR